jgi:enamine deaminase RidA (YjgF/YER057c/UK114 family)
MSITRIPGAARGRCKTVEHNGLVWTVATARGTTVAEQTRAALEQIEANLKQAGSDKHRIVEALVYLTDMSRKAEMDEVWCDWIPSDGWPCRACVGTSLAPGNLVEIKVTAVK